MKKTILSVFLILFAFLKISSAQTVSDVTLAWDANTEPDIAGYEIFWTPAPTQTEIDAGAIDPPNSFANKKDAGNSLTTTITGLNIGTTYYFAARAYDTNANYSGYSDYLKYMIPPPRIVIQVPNVPKRFRMEFNF